MNGLDLAEGLHAGNQLIEAHRTHQPGFHPDDRCTSVVRASKDELVGQLSTTTTDDQAHGQDGSHVVTVENGRVMQLRTYRNDHGLPSG